MLIILLSYLKINTVHSSQISKNTSLHTDHSLTPHPILTNSNNTIYKGDLTENKIDSQYEKILLELGERNEYIQYREKRETPSGCQTAPYTGEVKRAKLMDGAEIIYRSRGKNERILAEDIIVYRSKESIEKRKRRGKVKGTRIKPFQANPNKQPDIALSPDRIPFITKSGTPMPLEWAGVHIPEIVLWLVDSWLRG